MKYAHKISPEDKADYLEMIFQGVNPKAAAEALDSTGTQFHRCRSPKSQYYDPEFEQAFNDAYHSETRRRTLAEKADTLAWEKAESGDTKMIERLNLVHNPAWEFMRHQNLNVNIRAEIIREALPMLTDEQLKQAIEQRRSEVKLLPPAADAA
jgi:hypothetical protein